MPHRDDVTSYATPGSRVPGSEHARPSDSAVLAGLAAGAAERMAGENFPVALRLLPRAVRTDLQAVYGYARFVDQVGDEAPGEPADRLRLLDELEADVHRLPHGAILAPVAGLAAMVGRGAVPPEPLLQLIEANRLDQRRGSYETFDDLLGYCALSAAPVGRIVLHLAGAATERRIAWSDDVCAALQVLEHCQDVGEDARAGRVYLPATSLAAQQVPASELTGAHTSPALRAVVQQQAMRARDLLAAGPPLVSSLRGWARVAVAGYVAGGLATADALAAADHDVLAVDVRPSKRRTATHSARLLTRRATGRGGEAG